MVLIFLLFGYQKWFEYEAQTLVPFISNGPLTFWMYPVLGLHGVSYFLGVSDGWDPAAGFPAMKGNVAFTMKDVVLLAVSVYLFKQDVVKASAPQVERLEVREVGVPRGRVAEEVAAQ